MSVPPKINVIDCYHRNAIKNSDFQALKDNGIYAIIHKASQGSHFADPEYSIRKPLWLATGGLWGAYHFVDGSDIDAQVENFIAASGMNDTSADPFLIACDYEHNPDGTTASLQQCMQFMSKIDARSMPDVQSVLYSGNVIRENLKPSAGGHQATDMLSAATFFQQHRLWLAEYGPTENIPYPWNMPISNSANAQQSLPAPGAWLWQFTEKGRVNPLHNNSDGNFFDGTFEELQQRWLL